jgi:hypothetical protein
MRVCRCRRLASKAIDRTPLTRRNCPDNASSPLMQNAESSSNRLFSSSLHSYGDRQIKAGAFLPDIGRGQIECMIAERFCVLEIRLGLPGQGFRGELSPNEFCAL